MKSYHSQDQRAKRRITIKTHGLSKRQSQKRLTSGSAWCMVVEFADVHGSNKAGRLLGPFDRQSTCKRTPFKHAKRPKRPKEIHTHNVNTAWAKNVNIDHVTTPTMHWCISQGGTPQFNLSLWRRKEFIRYYSEECHLSLLTQHLCCSVVLSSWRNFRIRFPVHLEIIFFVLNWQIVNVSNISSQLISYSPWLVWSIQIQKNQKSKTNIFYHYLQLRLIII